MLDNQFDSLLKKIRCTLQSEQSVAVVGWRNSNHNKFTRSLLKDDKVFFFNASSARLPKKVGFVLFTRFVYHHEFNKLRAGKSHWPIPIELRSIKNILNSCADLLDFSQDQNNTIGSTRDHETAIPAAVEPLTKPIQVDKLDDDVLDFLTAPNPKEKYEMDNLEKLTRAFLAATELNITKPGYVGKKRLAKLRREYGVEETPPQLVKVGWIIGEVEGAHKQVGWYKPGPKMTALIAQENCEPEDKYELALHLVSQKDTILAQKKKIEEMLDRIETAEKVLTALSALK